MARNTGLIIGGVVLAVVGFLWYKGTFCNHNATAGTALCTSSPTYAKDTQRKMDLIGMRSMQRAGRTAYINKLAHQQGYH